MKAESNTMPQHPFVIDKRGELADITFFDAVSESENEEGKVWLYETYNLTIPYREDLPSLIAEQFPLWLETAKAQEQPHSKEPGIEERLSMMEEALLFLTLGGM